VQRLKNRSLKRKRIMKYFIDAAISIMEKEGLEGITIRKVADIAGYNSATLYNYFKNIDHLILYASIRYLSDYVRALPEYIKGSKNSYERYLSIWECFCDHSFDNPKIYNLIFLGTFSNTYPDVIEDYYSIYPDYLDQLPRELTNMIMEATISQRNLSLLQICASEGLLCEEDLIELNDLTMLIYSGLMQRTVNLSPEDTNGSKMAKTAVKYIRRLTDFYHYQCI
jgi:AcrR family transcriptional regulator